MLREQQRERWQLERNRREESKLTPRLGDAVKVSPRPFLLTTNEQQTVPVGTSNPVTGHSRREKTRNGSLAKIDVKIPATPSLETENVTPYSFDVTLRWFHTNKAGPLLSHHLFQPCRTRSGTQKLPGLLPLDSRTQPRYSHPVPAAGQSHRWCGTE